MSARFAPMAAAAMLWLACAADAIADTARPVFSFDHADFVLLFSVLPPGDDADWRPARLPDDWYLSRPGVSGTGWYRMTFDMPPDRDAVYSVYLPRVTARRMAFFVNGARIGVGFVQGDARVLNWDSPQRYIVSPALLRPGRNVLHIMVNGAADLRHGLTRVTVGPGGIILPIFSLRYLMQVDARWAVAGAAVVAGLIAFAFWFRDRRDGVMFWFAVTSLAWAMMAVPWAGPALGEAGFANDLINFPLRFAYAAPLLVLCLRVAGRRTPRGEAAIWLFTLGGAVLTPLMSEAARGAVVTIWSIAYLVALSALLTLLVWTRARQRVASTWILAAGLAGVVVLNCLDLGRWLGWLDYDNPTFAHFHVALVLFAIGATIAERHFKAVSAVERSNIELEIQVAEKTREIEASYQRLRDAERERVLANERSRIMADMHDGVGASLLGLLGTVQSGKAEPEAVRRRVHEAMLELRLAVDSLGPVDGDLAVVLGNVRHRMREPIEESGVRFQWLVGELPPVAYLTPKAILAIQRIVLEAIANALRHARARTIAIRTEVDGSRGRLLIHVIDDGTGFDPAAVTRGRGLDNLHNRAQGIGASVEIDSCAGAGTRVTLILPQAPL